MNKLILTFNPDCMTVHDLKEAVLILRLLVQRRELHAKQDTKEYAASFLASFETLTQNMETS